MMQRTVRWAVAGVAALALAGVVTEGVIHLRTPMATLKSCAALAADPQDPQPAFKPANLDFTLDDMNGARVALSSFRGKVLILDFWATWCVPCKTEIPAFVDMQNRYGEKGLQILGVSIDDTPAQLLPYARDMKMNYPVLVGKDHDDLQDAYGPLVAIPVSVVIARDGNVCVAHAGYTSKDEFEREIKALL
jgi:peroxiredoxin